MTFTLATRRNIPWLLAIIASVSLDGCSLLYDFNTRQCDTTSDCLKMGPQFANAICRSHVCVEQASRGGSGGASGGGASSKGGSTSPGGTDAGGTSTSSGGSSEPTGGSSSSSSNTSCSNEKCITEHGNSPWICRGGSCVSLTTSDCPVLIPRQSASELLKQQDVIVVGGYAAMANKGDFYDSQAIINWDLAFNEFNDATSGGLPPHSGGTQRPLVGLVCSTTGIDTSAVVRSVQHLTDTVQVPAILSTLSANFLYQAWLNRHSATVTSPKPVFFMSTGSADMQLANLADEGLMWHMLGDPRSLAAPVVTLLKQIERVVNAKRASSFLATGVDDPTVEPLRVTLVSSDESIMKDIASVLTTDESKERPGTMLRFNGKSWASNDSSAARSVTIQSARQHTNPDVSAAIAEVSANPPHVIIAMATSEFPTTVMPNIERDWSTWAPNRIRPTYVLSHLTFNSPQVTDVAKTYANASPPLDSRLIGVNYASAQESHAQELYAAYLSRLKGTYHGALSLDGTENFYDGAYYLLYSVAAAAAIYRTPTGSNIVDGLLARVISTSMEAQSIDIGPLPLKTTLPVLFGGSAGVAYSLYGTMGPPAFDRLSGTRISDTSAWCVQLNGAGTAWEYRSDGLIFDTTTREFSPAATGVPNCLTSYCDVISSDGGSVCRLE